MTKPDRTTTGPSQVVLSRAEAETYTLDTLQREIQEAIEYDLSDVPPEEGGCTDAQAEWAKETAERIAASWAMHRDGYVDSELEKPQYDASQSSVFTLAACEAVVGKPATLPLTGRIVGASESESGPFVMFEVDGRWDLDDMRLGMDLDALVVDA